MKTKIVIGCIFAVFFILMTVPSISAMQVDTSYIEKETVKLRNGAPRLEMLFRAICEYHLSRGSYWLEIANIISHKGGVEVEHPIAYCIGWAHMGLFLFWFLFGLTLSDLFRWDWDYEPNL